MRAIQRPAIWATGRSARQQITPPLLGPEAASDARGRGCTTFPTSLGAGQRCCGHRLVALHQESSATFVFAILACAVHIQGPCPMVPSEASPEVELIQDLWCLGEPSHRQLKISCRIRATEGRSNSAQPYGTHPFQPNASGFQEVCNSAQSSRCLIADNCNVLVHQSHASNCKTAVYVQLSWRMKEVPVPPRTLPGTVSTGPTSASKCSQGPAHPWGSELRRAQLRTGWYHPLSTAANFCRIPPEA